MWPWLLLLACGTAEVQPMTDTEAVHRTLGKPLPADIEALKVRRESGIDSYIAATFITSRASAKSLEKSLGLEMTTPAFSSPPKDDWWAPPAGADITTTMEPGRSVTMQIVPMPEERAQVWLIAFTL